MDEITAAEFDPELDEMLVRYGELKREETEIRTELLTLRTAIKAHMTRLPEPPPKPVVAAAAEAANGMAGRSPRMAGLIALLQSHGPRPIAEIATATGMSAVETRGCIAHLVRQGEVKRNADGSYEAV